jgi:2-polyprenyl-3-methyl-5-hydroxy-6-metoxy-1,4-benzoquinol methylase
MEIDFTKRSAQVEIMDDLNCNGDVVDQSLYELDVINRLLGGNAVALKGIDKLLKNARRSHVYSIADLGCGSGNMLRLIEAYAARSEMNVALVGIDANPNIVRYAQAHTALNSTIEFKTLNIFSEEFRNLSVDVFVATLFLHHFNDEQLVNFFKHAQRQARIGIVVNDIHRHPLAYYSFKFISTVFSKSAMVKFDGPVSVLRAFKKKELRDILAKAGIKNYSLTWKWAFRWQLIIRTNQ